MIHDPPRRPGRRIALLLLPLLGSCASESFQPSVAGSWSFEGDQEHLDGTVGVGDELSQPAARQGGASFLPFFGEAARERGYELPLPLGVGATVMSINRPTEISRVQAGVNGGGLSDVGFLQFEAEAAVRSAVARFDAWLLPVLNVYLLGGYIWNNSEVATTVNLPGNNSVDIVSEGELEGPLYGGGMTLVGGYKELFATLDANVTHSQLGGLSEFLAKLYSVRVGWNTKVGDNPFRIYTGATYWDTERTIEGTIPLGGGGPISTVEFAVDQRPVDPWTITLGTAVTVSDRLWLMLELGGWDDTQVVIGGVTFRF